MTSRKIVAVFDSREAAQNARASLTELGLEAGRISIADQGSSEFTTETSEHRSGFWAHVKEMFMPDSDRDTLDESLRRGGFVLVASVDEANVDEAIRRLESCGAVDLEQLESQWRAAGWNGGAQARATAAPADQERHDPAHAGTSAASAAGESVASSPRESAAVPVVEEKLRIGKREVNRGGVRVRSYVVEEPVHEEVRLREERVRVERRPVDAPARPVAKGAPGDLMQERTIEVTETAEQAVVGKEARITEEVVVSKEAGEHVEQIDDTVRRTKVEVEDLEADPSRRTTPPRTPDRPGRH